MNEPPLSDDELRDTLALFADQWRLVRSDPQLMAALRQTRANGSGPPNRSYWTSPDTWCDPDGVG